MKITSKASVIGIYHLPHNFVGSSNKIKFDLHTLEGLGVLEKKICRKLLEPFPPDYKVGNAFFTLHADWINNGKCLRDPGVHVDGAIVDTDPSASWVYDHSGAICLVFFGISVKGWVGNFKGYLTSGGSCNHVELDSGFLLEPNVIYYGNSHFIHESLTVNEITLGGMARITFPVGKEYINLGHPI